MSLKSEREKAAPDLCRMAGNPYHTTDEIPKCPYCRFFLEALRAAEKRAMCRLSKNFGYKPKGCHEEGLEILFNQLLDEEDEA